MNQECATTWFTAEGTAATTPSTPFFPLIISSQLPLTSQHSYTSTPPTASPLLHLIPLQHHINSPYSPWRRSRAPARLFPPKNLIKIGNTLNKEGAAAWFTAAGTAARLDAPTVSPQNPDRNRQRLESGRRYNQVKPGRNCRLTGRSHYVLGSFISLILSSQLPLTSPHAYTSAPPPRFYLT